MLRLLQVAQERMPMGRLFTLFVLLIAVMLPSGSFAQEAVVFLEADVADVTVGQLLTVSVRVSSPVSVHAFQCDLLFDPDLLALDTFTLGPFLSSTGRNAQPLGPLDAESGLRFGGYTVGEVDGASGDGVLAVTTWRAVGEGVATLELAEVILAGSQANPLSVTVNDGLTISTAPATAKITPWLLPVAGLLAFSLLVWGLRRRGSARA